MKRWDNLLPAIADIDNLRLAFWKASKGKRHTEAVLAYQENLEENLLVLQQEITAGKVTVGNYVTFKILDPKERLICASAFSEQVLHHALMNICHHFFERVQIHNSCASRVGKGTYFAVAQAQTYTRKYAYFLKLDVRKFFDSIAHPILKQQLACMFKETKLLAIFEAIIDSYEASPNTQTGVPIGNLTSQYFANHYLTKLDHFIKEQLFCQAYIRYMDDMLLFAPDKATLRVWLQQITVYTQAHLACELKPPVMHKTKLGVPFLGYLILPTHTRLLQNSKKRFFRKLKRLQKWYDKQQITEKTYQRHILPLLAFVQKAKTKAMRKSMLKII
jgi:RNA-directed DNA polymerase